MRMHRCAALLLLATTACGPFFRRGENGADPDRLTLCVRNGTVAYGNIVARAGQVRFDVMPGQQVCKPLIATGPAITLRAVTTGGGLAGPRRYEERLPGGGWGCWVWRLTDSPASAADLGPCPDEDDDEDAAADTADSDFSSAGP